MQADALQVEGEVSSTGTLDTTLVSHSPSVSAEAAGKLLEEMVRGEMDGPWVFTLTALER